MFPDDTRENLSTPSASEDAGHIPTDSPGRAEGPALPLMGGHTGGESPPSPAGRPGHRSRAASNRPGGPGSRGSHADRRRETRTRAFAAAIECLHAKGYAGSSMLAVARQAGISRGALLKQFTTKADLYAALVEQLLDEMREDTLAHVRTLPPGLPRAMARVDCIWELYKQPRAFAFLEIMLGSRADPDLSDRLAAVGQSRNNIEKQLLSVEFDDMGITDRRAAGLAGIQILATVRGLALERLLNRNDDLLDAAFARQRDELEAFYRRLMKP